MWLKNEVPDMRSWFPQICRIIFLVAFVAILSITASAQTFWIEPKHGFRPVDQETFEQIKKLKRSVFVSDLKREELSIQDFRSENHVYRVLRFCAAEEKDECFTSFYQDTLADENLHVATQLPGITAAQYESFFFCKDCGDPYHVEFYSPNRPLSLYACPIVASLSDDGVRLHFGNGCFN